MTIWIKSLTNGITELWFTPLLRNLTDIYPGDIPENIQDILLELGKKHFQTMQLSKELEAFWRPKFEKTAEWIAATEKEYRGQVRKVYNETNGEITYQLPGGDFTFTAKADRIDVLKDGSINIIDYKTGKIPSKKQVMSGHALQLPLEGLIAVQRRLYRHNKQQSSKANLLAAWFRHLGNTTR